MKIVEKKRIEKFNNYKINILDSLINGGARKPLTATYRNKTTERVFDRDSEPECNCNDFTE